MNQMHRWLLMVTCLVGVSRALAAPIDDACAKLAADWKQRLDEEQFAVVVAPPFVIAGDGGVGRLEQYRDRTILAAQRALRATYFQTPPDQPILILLFESGAPYRRLAKKWFNDEDVPHFGFFRRDNVMLMNVGTGTGTLVHELVHALLKPDFPDAPSWFNEGLASLYEQCSLDGDRIVGLKNWRLPALKQAIREQKLRPIKELIEDPRFYRDDLVGINYAHARYLLMYLQEMKHLADYYKSFRAGHGDDPSGLKTLEAAIAPQTLAQFEADWKAWVLGL